MVDVRPVGYVIGQLLAVFGLAMLAPMMLDLWEGNGHWIVFLESATVTFLIGVGMALACANAQRARLSLQQTFLLTTGVWFVLPIFAALPFWMGATEARIVDAFFEAMPRHNNSPRGKASSPVNTVEPVVVRPDIA